MDSTYTRLATRGATVLGFETFDEGLTRLAAALDEAGAPAYAFVYLDAIDRIGHEHGPGSAQFHAAGAPRPGGPRGVAVRLDR